MKIGSNQGSPVLSRNGGQKAGKNQGLQFGQFSGWVSGNGTSSSSTSQPDSPIVSASCDPYFDGFFADSVVESITSKHKPFLSKDRKLIKQVVEGAIRGQSAYVLNNALRRHFMELTDRFLQPLNRHYEGLIVGSPLGMTLSTLRSKPDIKPFKQESFLKTIEQSAPTLPVGMKRSIVDLYRAFLKSPNFASWLQHRTSEMYREWRRKYFEVLCEADVVKWCGDKIEGAGGSDVECVDLLLRMRDELNRYASYFIIEGETVRYATPTPPLPPETYDPHYRRSSPPLPPPTITTSPDTLPPKSMLGPPRSAGVVSQPLNASWDSPSSVPATTASVPPSVTPRLVAGTVPQSAIATNHSKR
ncbi:Protein dennd6b, partial [Quaeritorhiza haematococci]